MHNYEHKKLVEAVANLDQAPADAHLFSAWVRAEKHLDFLQRNAAANDFVIYATGHHTFIYAVAVSNDRLSPIDKEDLLHWNLAPYTSVAGYVTGGGRDGVWLERGLQGTGCKTLDGAVQLIFARSFEGASGAGKNYIEANQEYAHVTDIHWRPERRAYCRFDTLGDLDAAICVTTRDEKSNTTLVSFKWELLEEYLAATNSSLVRSFDFTLYRRGNFDGWTDGPEMIEGNDDLFFRQKVQPNLNGYARGVQIIRPRRSNDAIFKGITDGWFGRSNDKPPVDFVALDWRNKKVTTISTDPIATTNYFDAKANSLPFELSPAFFRPEVLLKYKGDRDKYTVGERDVSCRAAWRLQSIDVNEAGQVHAYIGYLRRLPYEEQLHWRSFNEAPKANISERAIKNDFEGEWVAFTEPLAKVLAVVRRWQEEKVAWWVLRDETLLNRVNTPLTASRDEWAEAFMDLAKLVVEGFETKPIRAKLDTVSIQYEKEAKTIALLEKLLNTSAPAGETLKLTGLRTVQSVRSKAKGHVGGSEAEQLAYEALVEHETFANHFRHVCDQVASELETIQVLLA